MLTDNDFYNFTMANLIYKHLFKVEVEYQLVIRSNTDLRHFISKSELENKLANIQATKLTTEEISFLTKLGYLTPGYLDYLKYSNISLPNIEVSFEDPQLKVKTKGHWLDAIFWETKVLSTINELLCSGRSLDRAVENLETKVAILKLNPQIKFMEFGTRRRFSYDWQESVIKRLKDCDNLIGTSNVWFAHSLDLPVKGTIAHQLYMVCAALKLYDDFRNYELGMSIEYVNKIWSRQFGFDKNLLIALTDTYGTDHFFKQFNEQDFKTWKGFRHDSADPIVFGNKCIEQWKNYNIDPMSKMLCFSDGLTLDDMLYLYDYFGNTTQVSFGWGTNLTNDTGLRPISMVFKPINCRLDPLAQWVPCVKLSDNISKATGDKSVIKHYKEFAEYSSSYNMQPVY